MVLLLKSNLFTFYFTEKLRRKSKTGPSFMKKFPDDIQMAEILTDGDPNILLSTKFNPQEKPDISGLFGEKKILKKKRPADGIDKKFIQDNKKLIVTHPRFLRENDHEIRIRKQPVNQVSTSNNYSQNGTYSCHLCNFSASRVNVIICHLKSHRLSKNSSVVQSVKVKVNSLPIKSKIKKREDLLLGEKNMKKLNSKQKKTNNSVLIQDNLSREIENPIKKNSDAELREKLLADWNEDSDDNEDLDFKKSFNEDLVETLINSNCEFKVKEEPVKISESNLDTTDFLLESDKILAETNSIARFSDLDISSVQSSDKLKLPKNESDNLIKKNSQILQKSYKTNANEARLSCFDFNEDDVQEPNISTNKKIPRNVRSKNISFKNDDNFNAAEKIERKIFIENNKILQVCTLDHKNTELSGSDSLNLDEPYLSLKSNKGRSCESPNNSFAKLINKQPDTLEKSFTNEASASFKIAEYFESEEKTDEFSVTNLEKSQITKKVQNVSLAENVKKVSVRNDSNNVAKEIFICEKYDKQDDDINLNLFPKDLECEKIQTNLRNSLSISPVQPDTLIDSLFYEESFSQDSQKKKKTVSSDSNLCNNPRKRQSELEDDKSITKELNDPNDDILQILNHSKIINQSSVKNFPDYDSEYCHTIKKQKVDSESKPSFVLQSLDLLESDESFKDIKLSEKISDLSEKVNKEHENLKNDSTISSTNSAEIIDSKTVNNLVDCRLENSSNQSKYIF